MLTTRAGRLPETITADELEKLREWGGRMVLLRPSGSPSQERARLILGLLDFFEEHRGDVPPETP